MSAGPRSVEALDVAFWRRGTTVGYYDNRFLRPVEVVLLVRHREALAGRVLELGCGAGRLTGYLIEVGGDVTGLDVAPAMLEHCRRRYPGGTFVPGDLRDLSPFATESFDAVVAPLNVLDVLDEDARGRVLTDIRRLLVAGGVLLMSSHNLARPTGRGAPPVLARDPLRMLENIALLPRRIRNRRRLRPLERRAADHAILNDEAHDFALLHYYVLPDAQQRQLEAAGYQVLERLDLDGRPVPEGEVAAHSSEIHYTARKG